MNIPMVTLAAFVAIIPLISSAQSDGCTLNVVAVPGDPELIEGTRRSDVIDCSTSSRRHDIYGYQGKDIITGSDYDDFIAGGSGNDIIYGGDGNDTLEGGNHSDVCLTVDWVTTTSTVARTPIRASEAAVLTYSLDVSTESCQ